LEGARGRFRHGREQAFLPRLNDSMSDNNSEIPLDSLEAARVAALLEEPFSLQVLLETGVDPFQLDQLFDQEILIQETETQAAFSDFACRAKVLAEIPWSIRRSRSLKLAECLELHKGDPEELGRLFLAAQNFERAQPYLIRAAESACVANDYPKALSLLRQVFEIWKDEPSSVSRARLLREMARCAANTGDYGTAIIAWEELLENARSEGNVAEQIEAHKQLAEWMGSEGRRNQVREHLMAAAELSSQIGEPAQEAKQWFEFAGFSMMHLRLAAANEALEKAYQASLRANDPATRIEIEATRALGQAMVGNTEKAFDWINNVLDFAIKKELPEQVSYVYRRMANVNEYSGNFQAYLDLELKALDRCRADEHTGLEQACLSCLSYAFFRCGHWKRSQEMLKLVLDELGIQEELRMVALCSRAAIAAFRGERRLFQASRKDFEELQRILGGAYMNFHMLWSAGVLAHLGGATETAAREYSDLIDLWRETEDRHDAVPGLMSACSFFADQNQADRVSECIDILNIISKENNNNESRSARKAALAESAWIHGRVDEAIENAKEALVGYEEQNTPIEIAQISRRLGKMFVSKGDQGRAEVFFEKSAVIARQLGMRPLLDALAADRSSLVTHKEGGSAHGLTRRQVEVLKLVADGLTNKEVANQLSLSPRTVEMHVGSILERLNCRARTDAIKKAIQLDLV
jgi:DNA-binding CsgD family transcriptional regulator/tetratricopeptide (TPR) repeat protein